MQTGENALLITFAQRIVPWLSVGANFKLFRYDLPITKSDQISGTGIRVRFWAAFKTGKFTTFGLIYSRYEFKLSMGYK